MEAAMATEDREDDWQLRDSELALMDAIKTILEIIMTAGIAKPSLIDKMLDQQTQKYMQKRMPNAVVVMGLIRKFVKDEQREEHRKQLRKILRESPAGSA